MISPAARQASIRLKQVERENQLRRYLRLHYLFPSHTMTFYARRLGVHPKTVVVYRRVLRDQGRL